MSPADDERAATVNPFPGPQPYRASDRARFYGRELVGHELASTILAHRCVALFGPSGAGKSSVMQAAVIPELDEDFDFRHVTIDGWPTDEAPVAWLLYTLHTQLKLAAPDAALGLYESVEWTVRQAFRRSDRPILIYLDQIEQLLLPHREAASVDAFLDWLDRFAERPLRGLHLVLAMREDYLGRFRDRARGRHRLLENGFRLGPLGVGEIVGAVCRAAADGAPPQTWSPAAMRTLMLQVRMPGQSESDQAEVQTAFAQIVCRALFAERAQQGGAAPVDAPVHAEPILFRYLESSLESLGALRGPAERLLEDHLIAADGTRTLLTEEAARASGLGTNDELDKVLTDLERAAILRAEQHRGTRYFELGHDWLAKKVHDRKQERVARELALARELELAAQRRAAEDQLRAAQAETRRARKVVAVVTVFALLALGLGVFAWTQQRLAQTEAERARVAEREAGLERDRAQDATREALEQKQFAEDQKKVAEQQREFAEQQKRVAEDQKKIAEDQKKIAEDQKKVAEASEKKAQSALAGQRRATAEAERQRSNAEGNLRRAEAETRRARDANLLAVALSVLAKDPTAALALLLEVDAPVSTRGWTAATVEALQRPASQAVLRGHDGYVVAARFSPDAALVATASHDRTARVSRVDGGAPPVVLAGHEDHLVDLEFSPDGRTVATASLDGTVRVWPRDGAGAPRSFSVGAPIVDLAVSPDGKRLAAGARDGSVRVFALDGPAGPRVLAGHTAAIRALAFDATGDRLVSASDDGTARVWPLGQDNAAPTVLRGHDGTVHAAAFSPDGARVVTAGDDRTARVYPLTGAGAGAPQILRGHDDAVYTAEFSPDGGRVVTASRDRTARIWPLKSGEPTVLRGHTDKLYAARFDPRGELVATASRDGTARIWPAGQAGATRVFRGHAGPVVTLEFSRDGQRLVTAAEDGAARVWDIAGAHSELVLRGHQGATRHVGFAAARKWVVTAANDRSARVWDVSVDPPRPLAALTGHDGDVVFAAFSRDARRVYTGALDGNLRIWTLDAEGRTGALERAVPLGLAGRPTFIALDPDGRRVLTGATDLAVVLDLAGGARVELRGHGGKVLHGAFSPDGARIVTAGDDRTARVWRADGRDPPIVLRGHEGSVYHAVFSPDGAHVLTASWDRTARVWSGAGGRPAVTLAGHDKPVRSAEYSHDGRRIITASDDGTAKIWHADNSGDVVTLYGHEGRVLHAVFGPDDHVVVTSSEDRSARVWAADFDNPALLRTKIQETTTVCLVPEQRVALLGEPPTDAAERARACEQRFGR